MCLVINYLLMKLLKKILLAAFVMTGAVAAQAQYYEIASQIPSLLSPALSGSMAYKGFVELTGIGGFGTDRANFIELSTTQGFQYSDWFFMGAGMGIDIAMARNTNDWTAGDHPRYYNGDNTSTMAMLPIFSDFRFNIGTGGGTSVYIDAKVGAAWFLGYNYLQLHDRTMGHGAQFLLQPSIGVRIPVNSAKPGQAVNIGLTYRLLTSNNNYSWYDNTATLNGFGASISFEW